MFGGAMDGVAENLTGIRDRQRRDRSAAVMPMLAGVANEAGVDPALAQLGQSISTNDMTPELQQAMMQLRTGAQGYENTRAGINETNANTGLIGANTARVSSQTSRDQATHNNTQKANRQEASLASAFLNNQQVNSGAPGELIDIAAMVAAFGEDNRLTFDDLSPGMEINSDRGDTTDKHVMDMLIDEENITSQVIANATDQARLVADMRDSENKETDRTEGRAAAALAKTEADIIKQQEKDAKVRQDEADAWADGLRNSFPPDMNIPLQSNFSDQTVSSEVREARGASIRALYTDNANTYTVGEGKLDRSMQITSDAINSDVAYMFGTDPGAEIYGLITSAGDGTSSVDTLGSLNESLGEDNEIDRVQWQSSVARIARTYSLTQDKAAQLLATSLDGRGIVWEEIAGDEDALMGKLENVIGDRTTFAATRQRIDGFGNAPAQAQALLSENKDLNANIEWWSTQGKDIPASATNIAKLTIKKDEVEAALKELQAGFRASAQNADRARGNETGTTDEEEETVVEPTVQSELDAVLRETQPNPNQIVVPSDVQVTGASEVDLAASQMAQDIQNFQRTRIVNDQISSIDQTLADLDPTFGGGVQNAFDYMFYTAEEAGSRRQTREAQADEVKATRSWFRQPENRQFLAENPQLIGEARRDPIGFWKAQVSKTQSRKPGAR
jgi:hypothetical protein